MQRRPTLLGGVSHGSRFKRTDRSALENNVKRFSPSKIAWTANVLTQEHRNGMQTVLCSGKGECGHADFINGEASLAARLGGFLFRVHNESEAALVICKALRADLARPRCYWIEFPNPGSTLLHMRSIFADWISE
jgi:hypothetical protein